MERAPIVIDDLVVGKVTRELTDREQLDPDFIIVGSDGQPVFHLVNVVDDLEMQVTHVIRGEDHLSNTSKHIALFRAFRAEPPAYGHIPLILNADGSKMSKRDVGASLTAYMEQGFAPEALVNYLLLLGWTPKAGREIVSLKDAIEQFDLPQIHRHNARFDFTKLAWMNGEYIRKMETGRYHQLCVEALQKAGIKTETFDPAYVSAALATCKEKIKLFSDLPPFCAFYFTEEFEYEPEAMKKDFIPQNRVRLLKLRDTFAQLEKFDVDSLANALKAVAAALGAKPGDVVHPARLACTGRAIGPSLYHLLEVLGKERVLKRLDRAIARIQTPNSASSVR